MADNINVAGIGEVSQLGIHWAMSDDTETKVRLCLALLADLCDGGGGELGIKFVATGDKTYELSMKELSND